MENSLSVFDIGDIDSGLLWKWNVCAQYRICRLIFLFLLLLFLGRERVLTFDLVATAVNVIHAKFEFLRCSFEDWSIVIEWTRDRYKAREVNKPEPVILRSSIRKKVEHPFIPARMQEFETNIMLLLCDSIIIITAARNIITLEFGTKF